MGLVTFYYSDYNHYIGVIDMVVTFCGHSQVANSESVMEWLRITAHELIECILRRPAAAGAVASGS